MIADCRSRIVRVLWLAAVGLLLAGCSGDAPFAPAPADSFLDGARSMMSVRGEAYVLVTELCPIEGRTLSRARGELTLALERLDERWYRVLWTLSISNPDRETFTQGEILDAHPPDPVKERCHPPDPVQPPPTEARSVLVLFQDTRASSATIRLRGEATLTAATAQAMIARPHSFMAVFATAAQPDGALGGRLHPPDPI